MATGASCRCGNVSFPGLKPWAVLFSLFWGDAVRIVARLERAKVFLGRCREGASQKIVNKTLQLLERNRSEATEKSLDKG